MNADGYRKLYDYHFTVNRRIWDKCIVSLSDEQFEQALVYSIGSIHNHEHRLQILDALGDLAVQFL